MLSPGVEASLDHGTGIFRFLTSTPRYPLVQQLSRIVTSRTRERLVWALR